MILTRIIELELKDGGKILIDNIDITKIPIARLRKAIKVIPQEAYILKGTMRKNIDPLD